MKFTALANKFINTNIELAMKYINQAKKAQNAIKVILEEYSELKNEKTKMIRNCFSAERIKSLMKKCYDKCTAKNPLEGECAQNNIKECRERSEKQTKATPSEEVSLE